MVCLETGQPTGSFLLGEPSLGVDRRDAPASCCGDSLTVYGVGDVTGGEHPFDRGCSRSVALEHYIPNRVQLDLASEDVRVRPMADGDEETVGVDRGRFARKDVAQPGAGDTGIPKHLLHLAVPQHRDLGVVDGRCPMIFDARNSSRLWTMVTALANLARNRASSIAESPPPTTSTRLSRKKNPSQVAHAETPRPVRRCSPGTSSQLADAPVAMITESAVYSSSPVQRRKGLAERSTRVTSTVSSSAPKRAACLRKRSIISGPMIPSGKPG